VKTRELKEGNVTLEFAVHDTGIGLTEEQRGKLFNSFEQADSSITRKYGGTGLGLAISKRMAELMGGTISVVSTHGVGSSFSFTAHLGLGTGKARHRVPTPDLRGRRMLVVDDNEHAREVISAMLRSMTFKVSVAPSGMDAIREVKRAAEANEPYEIIFLDWQMPELDGIVTAQKIRELGLATPPFMIMVTAYGRDDLLPQAKAAGIEDIVAKPVTASTLFDAAMNALGAAEGRSLGTPETAGELRVLDHFAGARVLLAEDNELNQEVATDLLAETGLIVDVAENGAIALEKLEEHDYDLVLMDMQMPVMDGVTATREIRKQARFANLPIVAMTANALSSDRDHCIAAGMNDHLPKPIDPDLLLTTLRQWIAPAKRISINTNSASPKNETATTGTSDAPGISAFNDLAGLDIGTGMRLARGREKLYLSLLRKFTSNQRDFATYMDAALLASDWETAIRLAHTLKGVAGQVGAKNIRAMAELMEHALKQRESPEVLQSVKLQIAEMMDELIAKIEARLPADLPLLLASNVNTQELQEISVRLLAQLEASDFAAGHLIEAHEGLLHAGLGPDFEKIRTAIQDFEFETAAAELKRLMDEHTKTDADAAAE
jgi:two-component system sensor histidine kinase/response regulator